MKSALVKLLWNVLPPLALFLIVVGVWQFVTTVLEIPAYMVPQPSAVARATAAHAGDLATAIRLTGSAALAGLALSLVVGTIIGLVFSQSSLIRGSVYPYAIFLQTVPSVALAPLVILWFGSGIASVIVVAFIISLFPIITNTTAGLLTVDRNLRELFEMSNASRWQVLTKLQLPNAIPYMVTGAKISCGLSVIGAIVGEFSAGYGTNSFGLGYLIVQTSGRLATDYLFAATLAAMLLGVAIFAVVSALGGLILKLWHTPSSATDERSSTR